MKLIVFVCLTLCVVVGLVVACSDTTELSGKETTLKFTHDDFQTVNIKGFWNTTIEHGDTFSVEVRADEALADHVVVGKDDGVLTLSTKSNGWKGVNKAVVATITMPSLRAIESSGAGEVTLVGFEQDELFIDVSGATSMKASDSSVNKLLLNVSGASSLELTGLRSHDAVIDVSGAGRITLNMTGGALTGDISGAGDIRYCGSVSSESISRSGITAVKALSASECQR